MIRKFVVFSYWEWPFPILKGIQGIRTLTETYEISTPINTSLPHFDSLLVGSCVNRQTMGANEKASSRMFSV